MNKKIKKITKIFEKKIQEFLSKMSQKTNRHFHRSRMMWEHIWMVLPKPFFAVAVVHLEYIEDWVHRIYRYRLLWYQLFPYHPIPSKLLFSY